MKKKINYKRIALILIGLILLALIIWLLLGLLRNKETVESVGFGAPLTIKKTVELETDSAQSKIFSAAGDTMWTRGSDGTLYTLTVPDGALILPSEVIITPLKQVAFDGYSTADLGRGVEISGNFSFIRPAFLTVQGNTPEPTELTNTGVVKWGRCNIGSRGYDPEVCAADNKVPFGIGIDPGRVMLYGSTKFDRILLNPTIPSGENVVNAYAFSPGYYMADDINKAEALDITRNTFAGSSDYTNQTEVLSHLLGLGGDLTEFKDEIAKFERQKKDYQREVVKGAILALSVGNEKAYQARMDDMKAKNDQNTDNPRSSFVPVYRYTAFLEQFMKDKLSLLYLVTQKAKAELPDYDPSSGNGSSDTSGGESFWDRLRDYNPFDKGDSNPGDDLPDYQPGQEENGDNLPDYPGDNIPGGSDDDSDGDGTDWGTPTPSPDSDEAERARRDAEDYAREARKRQEQRYRNVIGSSIYSCGEKMQAIEALKRIVSLSAEDQKAIDNVINKCANSCKTLEECEGMGDKAGGNRDAIAAINYRILAFIETGIDCEAQTKKTLENYGQNFCANVKFW